MTVLFLPIPGASFDFASLSFHVPMRGLAAKQAAAAVNDRAAANTAIRVFIMRRFRQKYRWPSILIQSWANAQRPTSIQKLFLRVRHRASLRAFLLTLT